MKYQRSIIETLNIETQNIENIKTSETQDRTINEFVGQPYEADEEKQ